MNLIYISEFNNLKHVNFTCLLNDYEKYTEDFYGLNKIKPNNILNQPIENYLNLFLNNIKYYSKNSKNKKINILILLDIIYNKTKNLNFNLTKGVYKPYFKFDTFFLLKNNIKFKLFFDNIFWKCNLLSKGLFSDEEFINQEIFSDENIFGLFETNFVIIKNNLPNNIKFKYINIKYYKKNKNYIIIKFYYKKKILCYLISTKIKKPLGLLETFYSNENEGAEKICFLRNNNSKKHFCVLYSNWSIDSEYLFLHDICNMYDGYDIGVKDQKYFDAEKKILLPLYLKHFPKVFFF